MLKQMKYCTRATQKKRPVTLYVSIDNKQNRSTAVTVAESEEDMKYTYEELQIMLDETEKAFDVMRKFADVTNEFLMREDIKPLYQQFLVEKASK